MISKKRRDQLLNMAFGEPSAEGLLYDDLTEDERKELDDLRSLRDGMKSLREVPECQLSKERLRSAILGSAVKRRPVFGWGFATATAAFVAMGYFVVQSSVLGLPDGERSALHGFDQPGVIGPTIDVSISPAEIATAPIRNGGLGEAVVDSVSTDGGPSAPVLSASRSGTESPSERAAEDFIITTSRSSDRPLWTTTFSFGGDEPSAEFAFDPEAADEHEPLVVVVPMIDDESGAFAATEVETFGDVVFGG